jgi:hypothetical protein
MLSAAESLFEGSGNKTEIVSSIKDVHLSANTIMRRTESISRNLRDQLMNGLKIFTSV